MHLVAAGISFHSAPIWLRERAMMESGEAAQLMRYLVGHAGLDGAVVLCTCNRTEFYLSCPSIELAEQVRPRLAQYLIPGDDPASGEQIYVRYGFDAAVHLFRVAAGLDSMVIGEHQVLGQFKSSHRLAHEAGTVDARLDFIMRRAISSGKRVRHETALGASDPNLSALALRCMGEILGGCAQKRLLIVGAGEMSRIAAQIAVQAGAQIMVASRLGESAQRLAEALGGEAVSLDELVLLDVDGIVSCTSSRNPVLRAAEIAALQQRRQHRLLPILDIGVPRDVEPAAAATEGVQLLDIDAIGRRYQGEMSGADRDEISRAEAMVAMEAARAMQIVEQKDAVGPTIAALVAHAEEMRVRELERNHDDAQGSEPSRLEAVTRALVRRLIHNPIQYLRTHHEDDATTLLVREIFGLDDPESLSLEGHVTEELLSSGT